MTTLDTIAAELERSPDAYGSVQVRRYCVELLAEVRRLRALNEGLAERCAAAAEVLGRIANKQKMFCKNCNSEFGPDEKSPQSNGLPATIEEAWKISDAENRKGMFE